MARRRGRGSSSDIGALKNVVGQKVAKPFHKAAKPVVDKVKKVAATGVKKYLSATNALANKVEKALPKNLKKRRPLRTRRRISA